MLAEKYNYVRRDEIKLTSELLELWYRFTKRWRPKLCTPGIPSYCGKFRSSRQYDDTSTLAQRSISKKQFDDIEWCVNQLPTTYQMCIQREMRKRELNRMAKKQVWSYQINISFDEVINAILPILRRRGLFDCFC